MAGCAAAWTERAGWLAVLCCAAIGLLGPGSGMAQEACRARLLLQNGANAEGCPSEDEVRSAVAGRLGYDPFCGEAELQVRVTIERQARLFAGQISLQDRGGASRGRRKIAGDYSRCEELASALTLAISIAIDPLGGRHPASPPARSDPAQRPAQPAPPPPQAIERPVSFDIGAGAGVAVGSLPRAAIGTSLAVRASWPRHSLGLEGQGNLPVTSRASSGRMKTSLFGIAVVPCLRGKWTSGCVLLSGGVLQAEGQELAPSRRASASSLTAGLRGELELPLPLSASGTLRLQVTVSTPFIPAHVMVSDAEVWKTPPVAGMAGALLAWRL